MPEIPTIFSIKLAEFKSLISINFCSKENKKLNSLNSVNLSKIINKSICYNQKKLSQFCFLASEKHKLIKEELNKEEKDVSLLREYYDNLNSFLESQTSETLKANFDFIKKYFSNRSDIQPRCCIKVFDEDKNIFTLARCSDTYPSVKDPYPKEANSAFKVISDGEEYFCCNTIPTDFHTGDYKNSQINSVENYIKLKQQTKRKISRDENEDIEWRDCWQKVKSSDGSLVHRDIKACYKSTLVIPLSLTRENLDQKFMQHFYIDPNETRIFFGFLCLDHLHEKFFIEEIDSRIGFIFADILSLYFIATLTYKDYSSSHRIASEMLT
jgi:hypothetical protein